MVDRHELPGNIEHRVKPELATEYFPYTPEGMPPGDIAVPQARSFLVVDRATSQLYIDGAHELTAEDLEPTSYEKGCFGFMRVLAFVRNEQSQRGQISGYVADIRNLRQGDILSGNVTDQTGEPQWYNRRPLGISGIIQHQDRKTVYAGDPLFYPFAKNLVDAMDELRSLGRLKNNVYEGEVAAEGLAKGVLATTNNVLILPLAPPGPAQLPEELHEAEGT